MRWTLGGSLSLRTSARTAATAALLVVGGICGVPEARADQSGVWSFDVELAPVCLDGTFPLEVRLADGSKFAGPFKVDTDVRGRLTGTFTVNGIAFPLTGTVKRVAATAKKAAGVQIKFTARPSDGGRDRISFSGQLNEGATTATGTAVGKGVFATGSNPFVLDLSSAAPETARIEYRWTQNGKGRFTGTGHVVACGSETPLKLAAKSTKAGKLNVTLKNGTSFLFKGVGPLDGANPPTVDWTAKGFGGFGSGSSLAFLPVVAPLPLAYPSIPLEFETDTTFPDIVPITGDAPRGAFTIAPPLPSGLTIDAATGVISGRLDPDAVSANHTYTVTAKNYAGESTDTFSFSTRVQRARSFAPELRFLGDTDYRHFLSRAEFGVRRLAVGTTLDSVKSVGLSNYIDAMLVLGQGGAVEAAADQELVNATDPPSLSGKFPSAQQLSTWWTSLLENSTNPFQERIAFFWAGHFAVNAESLDSGEAYMMKDYVNLYRYEGDGNLRSLLLKMAKSGAMLKFLNGNTNAAGAVNENFGREFWELFTLGVDNDYVQADIVEASRAWTGYKFVTDPTTHLVSPVADPTLHDFGQKNFLGQTIAPGGSVDSDYQQVVNLTLDNAHVAEYITTKLFEQFAFQGPHPSLVADMAAYLRSQNYELKPFLRKLFLSEAFFSSTSQRSQAKGAVDYALGFINATGLKVPAKALQPLLATMKQPPAEPPTVKGWPVGDAWFSVQSMADRANFIETEIGSATVSVNVANVLAPAGQRDPGTVVDGVAAMFDIVLTTDERTIGINYLGSSFQTAPQATVESKVRGLLAIYAQHPTYEIR
jgi:hypothetical protein